MGTRKTSAFTTPSSAKVPHFSSSFLTIAEVSEILGKSQDAITRWCQSGKLAAIPKAYGHKTQWLISPQAIEALQAKAIQQKAVKMAENAKPHHAFLRPWLKALASGGFNGKPYSPRTHEEYRRYLSGFLEKYSSLSVNTLQNELKAIPSSQFSKKDNFFKACLCFGKYLIRQDALEESFLEQVKPFRPKRHTPIKRVVVNAPQVDDILAAGSSAMEHALIQTLTTTGLRASELCDLTVDDIDLNEGRLTVRIGKGGKTRKVGLPQRTIDALQEWTRARVQRFPKAGPWLFVDKDGKQLTRHGLYKRLERLGKLAGVKVSPHALRRAFDIGLDCRKSPAVFAPNVGKGRPSF